MAIVCTSTTITEPGGSAACYASSATGRWALFAIVRI